MKKKLKNPFLVSFYIPTQANREIERQAKEAGLSRSQFIVKLVMDYAASRETRGNPE